MSWAFKGPMHRRPSLNLRRGEAFAQLGNSLKDSNSRSEPNVLRVLQTKGFLMTGRPVFGADRLE
jgi:hypothetical protein